MATDPQQPKSSERAAGQAPGAASGASGASAASAASANESSRAGTGLDTVLGKIVVERKLLSQDELEELNTVVSERAKSAPTSLADVLVEREFVTRKQLERMRGDLDAAPGRAQLAGFEFTRQIGKGAMGKVYLGRQVSLNRPVAIKEMKKLDASHSAVQRFLREARIGAKLSHNNIVQFIEQAQTGERYYLVMEYVDGDDIKKRIDERKVLPVDEALSVILQIANALDHMHGRGIIHRDIKPANIMMTRGNVAKLADLGLGRDLRDPEDMKMAKAEAGKAYGTPWYISPEQIRGREDVAGPADIYCLGATLYHMVTGKVPFDGANQSEVFNAHLSGSLVPPDQRNPQIDEDTALIVETMLQRDLLKRYRTARELIEDLETCIANRRLPAGSERTPLPHAKPDVDLTTISTSTYSGGRGAGGEAVQPVRKDPQGLFANPVVVVLAVALALSVALNIVLGVKAVL